MRIHSIITLICLWYGATACCHAGEVFEVLKNPDFSNGLLVKGIDQKFKTNRDLYEDKLIPDWADGDPVWVLSQWYSRESIADTAADYSSPSMVQWKNSCKTIGIGKPDTEKAGIFLGVDAYTEFRGVYRDGSKKDWPHLLVSQRVRENGSEYGEAVPSVGNMDNLRFRLSYRILSDEAHKTGKWQKNRHAARFRVNLTIQNLRPDRNRELGYGRFIWFVITLYDDRHPVLNPVKPKIDKSSGMMIYNVGLKPFENNAPAIGKWNHLDADILPFIKEALEFAWSEGVLTETRNLEFYRLGSMNFGYEVTGLNTIYAQVRDPSLQAVIK